MAKLTGDFKLVDNAKPSYHTDGRQLFEVTQENLVTGKNHYLIDSENNIIMGPGHVEGTSMFEKAHEVYLNDKGVIIGAATILVVSGAVLICFKNPALAQRVGLLSAELVNSLVATLSKIKPTLSNEIIKEAGKNVIVSSSRKEWIASILGVAATVNSLYTQALATEPYRRDPLLIDLDGGGIQTTNLGNGIYFDHDNNGFAESSAWVGSGDGIFVFDKNANGTIDNGNEIFGDNYVNMLAA